MSAITSQGVLRAWRRCPVALLLATASWAAGCASGPARPMIEPAFAARTYTPARIAILPPDVFVIYDDTGDNDPNASSALGKYVSEETVRLIVDGLEKRGYLVDLSARWDGIYGPDGQIVLASQEVGAFANAILGFTNSDQGGGKGPMPSPHFIAPDLSARLGIATNSDALLYINLKGQVVSPGKRTAQVVGTVFIAVVIVAVIALLVLSSKGGGKGGADGGSKVASGSSGGGRSVWRSTSPSGSAGRSTFRGTPSGSVIGGSGSRGAMPSGRGRLPGSGHGHVHRPYYGPRVGVGVNVIVPLGDPVYTHDGQVAAEDEFYGGDEIHVAMTLVSSQDGRVLWHIRESVDVEADDPADLRGMLDRYLAALPPSLAPPAGAAVMTTAPTTPSAGAVDATRTATTDSVVPGVSP